MEPSKQYSPSMEEFEKLLNETHKDERFDGKVVTGTVVDVGPDFALVDVGLKSEGRIPIREFGAPGTNPEVKIGDTIDVFVERIENAVGEAMLSRERARREDQLVLGRQGVDRGVHGFVQIPRRQTPAADVILEPLLRYVLDCARARR